MAHQINHLAELQAALRQTLNCEVVHFQTVPLQEAIGGKILWQGEVEVFELSGHPEAKICFAWLHHERDKSPRFVAVLENSYTNSPARAIKSAIFFDVQPVSLFSLNQGL